MDYLARDTATFSEEFWAQVDAVIVDSAKKNIVGRKFLPIFGPLGPGALSAHIDGEEKTEDFEEGIVRTTGRVYREIPQVYADFNLLWRDIANSEKEGYPIDLSPAMRAAETVARMEDKLLFFGSKELGIDGLATAKGINKIKRGNWAEGEAAYQDIAKGLTILTDKGYIGRYALVLSPDIYLDLQRIQPGTGVLEIDRVSKMVDGRIFHTTAMGMQKAMMVCAEPQYMDIAVGQDLAAAYLELTELNHHFRVLETVLPRVKRPGAVISYE